MIEWTNTEEKC